MNVRPALKAAGFTLTELAMVLLIVALLLGGLTVPLGAQDDMRRNAETQKRLADINEALLGYAAINKHLPCPMATTTSNPADARYGFEDSSQCGNEGILPWKTLGVAETDAWGGPRTGTADPFTAYWRYRVDVKFSTVGNGIQLAPSPTATSDALVVSERKNRLNNVGDVVAVVYSCGPNRLADGDNGDASATSFETGTPFGAPYYFDDRLIWISRPALFGRLAANGTL